MKRLCAAIAALFICATAASAGDTPKVTIEADAAKAGLDETLTITVSVSGGSPSTGPQVEGMENFELLGTSTGEQVSIVNMSMTTSKTFSYTVRPKKAGLKVKLRARVDVKGEKYLSNVIEVETVQSGGGGNMRRQGQNFFNAPLFGPMFGGRTVNKDDFILAARISRARAYAGQEVVYRLAFYRGAEIFSNINFQPPETKGFWTEVPPEDQRYKTAPAKLAGRQYELTEAHFMLYPLSPGTIKIPPGMVRFQPDPTQAPMARQSNELSLTVLPLPEAGKPKDFSGLVGKFSITASIAEKQATAGRPLTLNVTVAGSGNLHAIPRPQEPPITGADRYEPEAKDGFTRPARGSQGNRTFTYVLVPHKEGKLVIGPFRTNAFDPQAGKYETLSTAPMEIDVGMGAATGATPPPKAEEAAMPPAPQAPFHEKPAFFAMALAAVVVLLGGTVWAQRRNQILRDEKRARRIRAKEVATERLEKAATALNAADGARFYTELEHAVRQYISDKFDLPPSSVTPEGLAEKLGEEQAARVGSAVEVLRRCTAARYAPGGTRAETAAMKAALETAIAAIREMEK